MNFELTAVVNTLLRIVENVGLLLGLTFIYSVLLPIRKRYSARLQAAVIGLVFGLAAAIVMVAPVELGSGFRFDSRNAVIAMATVYGGLTGGLISSAIAIPMRLALGGTGALSGVISILTTMVVSVWFCRRHQSDGPRLTLRQLVVLGVLISVFGMAWIFLAPLEQALDVLQKSIVPVLVLNPLAMVFVGALLRYEERRVALEDALRESEYRFRQIAEASDQMLWTYEPTTQKVLYISPAYERIWGRSVESLHKDVASFMNTIHPDDREIVRKRLRSPLTDGSTGEVRILRPDGSVRWIFAQLYPVRDGRTGASQIVGVVADITERKNAETQRLALEFERKRGLMLRQFVNDASHDLRTPVTVMNTSIYLLGRTLTTDRQKEYLNNLQVQVNRMNRLIEDMMAISELDAYEGRFPLKPMLLNDVAGLAYTRRLPETEKKDRTLTTDFTDEVLWIGVDEGEIAKAIDRVMKNAVAYTSPGGHIHISTYRRGSEGIIAVRDDGVGIEANDLPHIFKRFYRADRARGTDFGGAGLGLSIAHRAVELHGGSIEAESTPGEGSTFRFVFPLVDAPEPSESPFGHGMASKPRLFG